MFIGLVQWLYGKSCSSADTNELVPRAYSAEVKGTVSTDWYGLVPWNGSPMLVVLC